MERAGFTKLATRIVLKRLVNASMISVNSYSETMNDTTYYGYTVTDSGSRYILRNQDKIEIRRRNKAKSNLTLLAKDQTIDDDVPF
jgi:hypothetical protein